MPSPPKEIPVKSLLNAASDFFFDSQMKKKKENLSKTTTTELYTAKERKKT